MSSTVGKKKVTLTPLARASIINLQQWVQAFIVWEVFMFSPHLDVVRKRPNILQGIKV